MRNPIYDKIGVAKSTIESAHKTLLSLSVQEIENLHDFNLRLMSEVNIHTDSFRYKQAYSIVYMANILVQSIESDHHGLAKERYEYQQEHNIVLVDNEVVVAKPKVAKTKGKATSTKPAVKPAGGNIGRRRGSNKK